MFYIDFTSPDGTFYRIDIAQNPIIYFSSFSKTQYLCLLPEGLEKCDFCPEVSRCTF